MQWLHKNCEPTEWMNTDHVFRKIFTVLRCQVVQKKRHGIAQTIAARRLCGGANELGSACPGSARARQPWASCNYIVLRNVKRMAGLRLLKYSRDHIKERMPARLCQNVCGEPNRHACGPASRARRCCAAFRRCTRSSNASSNTPTGQESGFPNASTPIIRSGSASSSIVL